MKQIAIKELLLEGKDKEKEKEKENNSQRDNKKVNLVGFIDDKEKSLQVFLSVNLLVFG